MTRVDLDAYGIKLADAWHDAASWSERRLCNAKRREVIELATTIADGNPTVACYLGARIYDRLKYMGAPGDAQIWLDDLERRAVVSTGG